MAPRLSGRKPKTGATIACKRRGTKCVFVMVTTALTWRRGREPQARKPPARFASSCHAAHRERQIEQSDFLTGLPNDAPAGCHVSRKLIPWTASIVGGALLLSPDTS